MVYMHNIEIYGHRGASRYALENTWNAFRKACELGVGIEMDVQITKDGVVLVYHDDNLKRLSGRNLYIADTDYENIKELKIGRRGLRNFSSDHIPLAYEVFHWAKDKSVPLNIELKESFAAHPEGPKILASMLEGLQKIHLSSFNPEILRKMKTLKPDIETALIVKKNFQVKLLENMHWIDSVHLHKRLYTDKLASRLESMKKNIRVYGIVGSEQAVTRPSPHLTGIITDYPAKIIEKMRTPE